MLGNAAYYLRFVADPLAFVGARFDRYGDLYCAPNPDGLLFVLRHPDHLREVLAQKSGVYRKTHSLFDRLARVLGNGLVTTDGDVWRRHRRMIQPAFHRDRLEDYAEPIVEEAERATEQWQSGTIRDVGADLMALTLRIVSRLLFSHDASSDIATVAAVMAEFQRAIARPELAPPWLPSPQRRRIQRATTALDTMLFGMVDARRRALAAGGERPRDLLQRLIDAVDEQDGAGLSRQELRDELVTLLLAGHETTSHALSWTLYLLAEHPAETALLTAELDSRLHDRVPKLADLATLPRTGWAVEEAMRLYPPAYMLARRAAADTTIGGYEVPCGSEITMWTYFTHRDARWFPEPTAFRPTRFESAARQALPKLAYLPFGGGPRACIGAQLALLEARLILASWLRRWRFERLPEQQVQPQPRITLRPKHGLRMRVTRR